MKIFFHLGNKEAHSIRLQLNYLIKKIDVEYHNLDAFININNELSQIESIIN